MTFDRELQLIFIGIRHFTQFTNNRVHLYIIFAWRPIALFQKAKKLQTLDRVAPGY